MARSNGCDRCSSVIQSGDVVEADLNCLVYLFDFARMLDDLFVGGAVFEFLVVVHPLNVVDA